MPFFGAYSHLGVSLTLIAGCAAGASTDSTAREGTPALPTKAAAATEKPVAPDEPVEPVEPAPDERAEPAASKPKAPPRTLPKKYLTFSGACDEGEVVTIAAVGDIMGHRELQRQAYKSKERFGAIWSNVADLLGQADLSYANLETPLAHGIKRDGELGEDPGMAFDNDVYSGYARFNAHKTMAKDLRKAGFDVVSVANNHSLDRGSLGIDRTLDALDKAKLKYTGSRRKGSKAKFHTVTEAKGIRIGWLACTLHTNFGKDEHNQVLYCFRNKGKKMLKAVEALAADPKIDAVIVTPHWGKEYSPEPSEGQIKHAQQWIDAGATAVIGSHPHVLEPWAKVEAADGREAFVMYSLGNFMSHQRTLNRRSTMILYFGLRKRADGVVEVVGARYVPLHCRMVGNKAKFFVEAIDRVKGPADARALIVGMFGRHNLLPPEEALVVNPHCDAEWAFPKR